MMKNEKTSSRVAKIAARALKSGKATKTEIRILAGTALTQTANNPKRKRK